MPPSTDVAPDVLKLVGHDVRWQVLRVLAQGDHRVGELVELVGQPQNLVSYHLRVLRDGDLVAERRSSADARDIYYHLDQDRLGRLLNDSVLRLRPVAISPRRGRSPQRPRVLFICTGNSARSQIAEAVARHELGSNVDVHSAGPAPSGVHPLALQALQELDIATAGLRSKAMEEVRGIDFDLVITLCDKARDACPPEEPNARYVHWSLPDPALVGGGATRRLKAFRGTAAEIANRVRHLVPVVSRLQGGIDV